MTGRCEIWSAVTRAGTGLTTPATQHNFPPSEHWAWRYIVEHWSSCLGSGVICVNVYSCFCSDSLIFSLDFDLTYTDMMCMIETELVWLIILDRSGTNQNFLLIAIQSNSSNFLGFIEQFRVVCREQFSKSNSHECNNEVSNIICYFPPLFVRLHSHVF